MLDNKLGLTNSAELAQMEEKISKKKALLLFESGYLHTLQPGTLDSLLCIHRYLFQEIYDFAGNVRAINRSKGSFRFVPVLYLNDALKHIELMPQTSLNQIIEKYVEMNIAHPFQTGNGRSMRIWLDLMLNSQLNLVIDWSRIDKDDYLLAMERSPIKDIEIKYLFRHALTDRIKDRDVYIMGIDYSYDYDGYTAYKAEDL